MIKEVKALMGYSEIEPQHAILQGMPRRKRWEVIRLQASPAKFIGYVAHRMKRPREVAIEQFRYDPSNNGSLLIRRAWRQPTDAGAPQSAASSVVAPNRSLRARTHARSQSSTTRPGLAATKCQ